jgi:hypothetical protein
MLVVSLALTPFLGVMALGGGLAWWVAEGQATLGRVGSVMIGIAPFGWWITGYWVRPDWIRNYLGTPQSPSLRKQEG